MTDTTNTVRGTFESLAYGLFASMMDLENAMPSPMEKGDRGAVDKGNPGIKESDAYEKKRLSPVCTSERCSFYLW